MVRRYTEIYLVGYALELDLVDPSFRGPSLRRIPSPSTHLLAEAKMEAP